uniref:F-box/LRR-repeat protein 15/At3g58940/PEG3-like LRR domain-containing protein n=1 Tax=Aegilops tauschii subsp. strangulata TaxID=200361 RepID=A0A453M661_AEGTS
IPLHTIIPTSSHMKDCPNINVCMSPSLTTLRLVSCFGVFSKQLANVIKESPLLELHSLELENIDLIVRKLTAVLESCPVLEVLGLQYCFLIGSNDEHALRAEFTRIKITTLKWDDECRD